MAIEVVIQTGKEAEDSLKSSAALFADTRRQLKAAGAKTYEAVELLEDGSIRSLIDEA